MTPTSRHTSLAEIYKPESLGSATLNTFREVHIQIGRGLHAAMPGTLPHDRDADASLEQEGCVHVAHVVESNTVHLGPSDEDALTRS